MKINPEDKAKALVALYEKSFAQNMGLLAYRPGSLTVEEAQKVLDHHPYVDYLLGRVIKVDFSGEDLNFRLYDRDNGEGAGEEAVLEILTRP